MKKILLLSLFSLNILFSQTLLLTTGWNLVGINAEVTISELQTQLGINNLLVVQGSEKVYKKAHIDANLNNLNDFTTIERNKAYWIKIENNATLDFEPIVQHQNIDTIALREGWNLISSPKEVTLSELVNQIGLENLLIVQGTNETYQKSYIDQGFSNANDLDKLESNQGYWIKVRQATQMEFLFNVDKVAVDNKNLPIVQSINVENVPYTLKVFSNTVPTQETSPSTLAIIGSINGISTQALLKLNSFYTQNTAFVVKVYNKSGVEIAQSFNVKYTTSPINFGNISFNTLAVKTDNRNDETTFNGLRVFAQVLNSNSYGLESITDSDFNGLSSENQHRLVSKLYASLFYGTSKIKIDALIDTGTFISNLQTTLDTPNLDIKSVEKIIAEKDYNWSQANGNREKILARLMHLGLGKEYMRRWVAYVLSQNILFSPANSLETVENSDILGVYNRLVRLMDDDYSMQMITYLHTTSEENWRRFRSPEDNGREMLEIYTLDFNDSHVPKAAIALQNWRLNRRDNELIIDLNENDVPQELFGTTVTTGFDFYREMVKTQAFTKGIITRLVNQYFPEHTKIQQAQIITNILNSNPTRFEDILLQIVFSKEFLLHSSKIKTIEESAFSIAKSISFFDARNFFGYLRDSMDKMHQSPLNYKLGRDNLVPTDTLSFAYYYDFLRRRIMNDTKGNNYDDWDGGWKQEFISKEIPNTDTVNGLVDYLFMAVISRKASSEERNALADYAISKSYDEMQTYNDRVGVSKIVMEYLSRLSELYRFQKIEE